MRDKSNAERPARVKLSREETLKRMEEFPSRRDQFVAAVRKGTIMSETAERLKMELASLSDEDRAELAHFLLESLPPEDDDLDEATFNAELERRIREIDDGTAVGEPAEKVLAELRAKHS